MAKPARPPTPGQVASITLAELVAGYQERLLEGIRDRKIPSSKRTGLRLAGVMFRDELARLGITDLQAKDRPR